MVPFAIDPRKSAVVAVDLQNCNVEKSPIAAPEANNRRSSGMGEISSLRAATLDDRTMHDPEPLHRAAGARYPSAFHWQCRGGSGTDQGV
jgi:hypothetical protein